MTLVYDSLLHDVLILLYEAAITNKIDLLDHIENGSANAAKIVAKRIVHNARIINQYEAAIFPSSRKVADCFDE